MDLMYQLLLLRQVGPWSETRFLRRRGVTSTKAVVSRCSVEFCDSDAARKTAGSLRYPNCRRDRTPVQLTDVEYDSWVHMELAGPAVASRAVTARATADA